MNVGQIDFIAEPDIFHDAFGHLPMHADPTFSKFIHLYGKTAYLAKTEQERIEMQRLYWFSVEYCLIHERGELKVCGSGHLSGFKEAPYSLTSKVKKKSFVNNGIIFMVNI